MQKEINIMWLNLKHTERQRQRPMLVYGDAWERVWDRSSSVTMDQHWTLSLTLGVVIPLVLSLPRRPFEGKIYSLFRFNWWPAYILFLSHGEIHFVWHILFWPFGPLFNCFDGLPAVRIVSNISYCVWRFCSSRSGFQHYFWSQYCLH